MAANKSKWRPKSVALPTCPKLLNSLLCRWTGRLPVLVDRLRVLLRAVGLSLLAILKGDEAPKILVRRSWLTALAQCAVHVLPACVSICLLGINLQGIFIGNELQGPVGIDGLKFGLLQVAAKLQVLEKPLPGNLTGT